MVIAWRIAVFVSLLALAGGPSAFAKETPQGPIPAEVLRVIDADTLDVRARIWLGQSIEIRVRLDKIDTPEIKSKCALEKDSAQQAKALVVQTTADKHVVLRDMHYGKFAGRVVGRIEVSGGKDLAKTIIASGLGRPYAGGKCQPWCPPD
jgi:micrococcal nuclease